MIVKRNPKLFSSIPIPIYTDICSPRKWLSFPIFICTHTQTHISIGVKKCKLVQYVFLSASDTENQGFVCVCEMPLCILGPFTFWSQCFLIYLYLNSSYEYYIYIYILIYIYISQSAIYFLIILFLLYINVTVFSVVKLAFFLCDVLFRV